ncbi:MAG TPA: hypothetical protein DEF88_03365 [Porphyromonadaceae bacterium]|nr:hypothetical protein [Porphyromonadaceae bacterium]HCM20464.1 hypothetical protein [Porphyromonadaceae bacterium]
MACAFAFSLSFVVPVVMIFASLSALSRFANAVFRFSSNVTKRGMALHNVWFSFTVLPAVCAMSE